MTSPFPPDAHLAAYLRDSGGDDQDLSVEQQEAVLRAWCAERGLTLTQIFRDTRSGTSTIGRTGFEAMIRYFFQKKRVPEAGLILWRYNRFARDLDDAQYFKAGLRRRGYIIHSIQDPIPEGSAGRAIEFFYDWMADKFSEDLSVEVKRGQRHLFEQYGALGGCPPRGFKRSPIDLGARRDGSRHIVHRWVPDPDLWETCRLAWQMRAAGASYKEIHEHTHLYGSANSYTTFFSNRLYLGEMRFEDLVHPTYAEPLIDQATWDAVQAINASHTRNTTPRNPHHARRSGSSFLLSGLAYCARCGTVLSGDVIRPANEQHIRGYYVCGHNRAHFDDCPAQRLPQYALEEIVTHEIILHIIHADRLEQIQAEQGRLRAEQTGETRARRAEITGRLKALRLRIHNVADAIETGGQSPALLERLRSLEGQEAQLKTDLVGVDAWLQGASDEISPERLDKFAQNFATLLRSADLETRKRILKGFIEKITVQREGRLIYGTITYYQPSSDLVNRLADLPALDDLVDGTDAPLSDLYAYAPNPPGGTPCKLMVPKSS